MKITKTIEANLRDRIKETDGGLKQVVRLSGLSGQTINKMLKYKEVNQSTYDAFCEALTQLETHESNPPSQWVPMRA